MLKNKKAVYILIPLNVLIWGFFAYRFLIVYDLADSPTLPEKTTAFTLNTEKDSVQYKLVLNYKDPFLRKSERSYTRQSNIGNVAKTPVQKPREAKTVLPPKNIPEIKYMGLIKNTNSGASTALISVNGQSKLVKQNETIEGILFRTFTNDSLIAKYGKERIVVKK